MIIWINGAYGVGKSTLAEDLAKKMENAMVFDAEAVGNAVRGNYPNDPYGVIFEDYPLWHEFNYQLLKDIHNTFGRNILVPMTLVRPNSYSTILKRLMDDRIDTKLIVLEASYQRIHDRILARGEGEDCWCMRSIEMARNAVNAMAEGYHICTDNKSVEELSRLVLAYIGQETE